MSELSLPTFTSFFQALHGHAPFPWQARAAARLARRELGAVTVPTGLGKSALIDAAIWAAAHGAWRRIAYVVDRRLVVDAVHERAQYIRHRLLESSDPGLRALGDHLGEMQVVRLRGGVHGDDDWVLYPDRLSVVLSTVDQIGSRLLFRGYGVSARRWPMHAAFFASDTLIVIDEAHLSAPFLQTLRVLREAGARFDMLPMSATLGRGQGESAPIQLESDDLELPTVQQRLHATKHAQLIECEGGEAALVKQLSELAAAHLARAGVKTVAIIVNRVQTARLCHARLRKDRVESALLIGRTRPAARDHQLTTLLPRLLANRTRRDDDAPLVIVATQTIEVGADFDFDALVTESAPLSALRQRFGRLDRLGQRGQSQATIVHRLGKSDPVYGDATAKAWDWLTSQACPPIGDAALDFGLLAFEQRLAQNPPPPESLPDAATLLPIHLEMLSQTGVGAPELDLAAWLHGPTDRAPDVALIWRDDMLPDRPDSWIRCAELLPPLQRESLALSASAVRRWLAGQSAADLSDLGTTESEDQPSSPEGKPVLRWFGPGQSEVIFSRQIRPGDTVLLPSAYGGCDEWGWAPDATHAVHDLADSVLIEPGATRRATARLTEGHWPSLGEGADLLRQWVSAWLHLQQQAEDGDEETEQQRQALCEQLEQACANSSHPLVRRLGRASIEPHPHGVVLRAPGLDEFEGVIETGRAVTLDEHHADVARWAHRLAAHDPERDRVVEAAAVHDAGKAEARMQILLHGNRLAALAGPPLAKSAQGRRADQLAAYKASQLPRGFRHEFASLRRVALSDSLTRHLVASHHGHGRPWGPACEDPEAEGANLVRLDSHWTRSWSALVDALGPWRLAELEWLVRAADARASIEEASEPNPSDVTRSSPGMQP